MPADSRRASFDSGPLEVERLNRILDVARPIAQRLDASLAQVSIAWLLAQSVATSVPVGAKKLSQLDDNLKAADLTLSPEDLGQLNAASELPSEYPGWFVEKFEDT